MAIRFPTLMTACDRRLLKILFIASLVSACIIAWLFDPVKTPWLPRCMLYTWTGIYCPGCGNTRALHALVHGHILTSLKCNVLLVPYLTTLGILIWKPHCTSRLLIQWILVTVLVFTLLRNLPWHPFTLLVP